MAFIKFFFFIIENFWKSWKNWNYLHKILFPVYSICYTRSLAMNCIALIYFALDSSTWTTVLGHFGLKINEKVPKNCLQILCILTEFKNYF